MRTQINESLEYLKEHWTVGELEVTYKTANKTNIRVNGPEDAFRIFRSMWDDNTLELQEQSSAIFLNARKKVIGFRNIGTGSGDKCIVDIPLLLSLALLCRAHSVIIAHNHPSSNLAPSKEDARITDDIRYSLKSIKIELEDHIVVAGDRGYSMIYEEEITLGLVDDLYNCESCNLLLSIISKREEEIERRKRTTKLLLTRISELKKQLNDARKTIRQHKKLLTA